ncbi:MAG: Spy/CpxP family protein refolding chaperone [Myxococcales bacterium]|nr:Spy/CpxP family protein refolding chaperone [Myxococcales bacterium]
MTRWITAFTLPLTLVFAACDSEPVDDRAAAIEQAADDDLADAEAGDEARHEARGEHRRRAPGERLCATIECSGEQEAQIADLFAKNRPAKGDFKAHHEAGQEQRKALADAFRAGTLTADDLRAHHEAMKEKMAKRDPGAMLVELHALLTPEQRAIVADKMETRGLHFFGGKHGKRGKHGDDFKGDKPMKDGDHAGKHEAHMGKRIDKLCAKVECTDEQRATLEAKAAAAHEARVADRDAHKEAKTAAKQALAQAFRGDSFSAADVDGFKGSMESMHGAKASDMEAMILDLQALFTAEQRGVLADKIEKHGVGALMGKHGKHGKRGKHGKKGERGEHGKRGKHGKMRGEWGDAPEDGRSDEV